MPFIGKLITIPPPGKRSAAILLEPVRVMADWRAISVQGAFAGTLGLLMTGTAAFAGGKAPACPAQDFPKFLNAFSESIELQKTFTRFPYKLTYLEDNPKPGPTEDIFVSRSRMITLEQAEFPLLANAAERKARGLFLRVDLDQIKGQEVKAVFGKDGADFTAVYHFIRNSCWELILIDDQSL